MLLTNFCQNVFYIFFREGERKKLKRNMKERKEGREKSL